MNKEDKDYFFYIKWEDTKGKLYKIGILAQIEEMFYLRMYHKVRQTELEKLEEEKITAYDNGCIGIPGFKRGKIYRSQELFDFFKNRILGKDEENPCEELKETNAKSLVDSFSVEEIVMEPKKKKSCKDVILKLYEEQLKKENIEINNNMNAHSI